MSVDGLWMNGYNHVMVYFNGYNHFAAYKGNKLIWMAGADIDPNTWYYFGLYNNNSEPYYRHYRYVNGNFYAGLTYHVNTLFNLLQNGQYSRIFQGGPRFPGRALNWSWVPVKNIKSQIESLIYSNKLIGLYGTFNGLPQNIIVPICKSPRLKEMPDAYRNCAINEPYWCGNNVIDFSGAYQNTKSLIGLQPAVCGPNVTDMSNAYYNCQSVTMAACGPNVVNMAFAYASCQNLTTVVCGPNVTNMVGTYGNCPNVYGQMTFNKPVFTFNMFGSYVPKGPITILVNRQAYASADMNLFNSLFRMVIAAPNLVAEYDDPSLSGIDHIQSITYYTINVNNVYQDPGITVHFS